MLSFTIYDSSAPNIEWVASGKKAVIFKEWNLWLVRGYSWTTKFFFLVFIHSNLVVRLLTQAIWSDLQVVLKMNSCLTKRLCFTFCEHSKEQFPGVPLYFYENSLTLLCAEFLNKISISIVTNHKREMGKNTLWFFSEACQALLLLFKWDL